jgi:hypothetical protein
MPEVPVGLISTGEARKTILTNPEPSLVDKQILHTDRYMYLRNKISAEKEHIYYRHDDFLQYIFIYYPSVGLF